MREQHYQGISVILSKAIFFNTIHTLSGCPDRDSRFFLQNLDSNLFY